ncbi:MAG: DUF6345 domain-containing protein [Candidatus Thorarchaeota archaeon]
MKQDAILTIILLLLVVSVPVETQAPVIIDSFDSSKYVLSQTEMPIYELITPEVNESHTEEMARSLFDIAEIQAEEAEGVWVVNYLNQTFEMDRRDGSIWYADYDKIWNVALGIEVPTPSSCQTTADTWLREKGLLPANAVLADIGSTNVSAFNPLTEELNSKVLQYHVNYEFMVGDIPVTGETAQISVMIGNNGDIVGFDWKYRETKPEPHATFDLIEFESVLDAHGIFLDEVVDHRLVYRTDDDDDNNDLLYPVWEIEIVEDDSDDIPGIINVMYIDATLLRPIVDITTPSHGLSMMPGTSITFDCNVAFGTPPYTYVWSSDFDGSLALSQSFTTNSLSEVLKKDYPVPHAISVRVRDAEGRGCSDCIAVTIETVDFTMDPQITLVAVGSVTLVIAALLVLRRRKGGFALLFLLMMFSAFIFLPVSFASSDMPGIRQLTPSAPSGAYDDGVKEIGIEWVGMSDLGSPLWNTEMNIEGFYDWMGTHGGFNREFNWGEWSAWEEDFKDLSFSGTDTEWVDCVDMVYYQDHGNPNGVSFTSQHDDGWLSPSQMRLGNGDLETIVFDACSPLAWVNEDGDNVYERWGQTLQGLHQICSFATTSHNAQTRGVRFGLYMTGLFPVIPERTIVQAWFKACMETEGSDIQAAVLYASKSPNPLNPQLDDPINDHAYGFGYVCSDPTPGTFSWYVYITSGC